ncbi:hypothetical protein TNCT_517971 [Trichonephila clavata]|uniref:Uncharacterized protein n=1 Tax=Trichonephila clavata TaxID=2740835 RepID=A0A8X6F8Z3_TRICU|nr:hypothetical protein TNCT_517971 [Trichonephila clavata]
MGAIWEIKEIPPLLGFLCREISFLDLRDSLTCSAGVGRGKERGDCDVTIHLPSLGRGTDPRASGGIRNFHQTCPRSATESNVSSRLFAFQNKHPEICFMDTKTLASRTRCSCVVMNRPRAPLTMGFILWRNSSGNSKSEARIE